jgi:integrase
LANFKVHRLKYRYSAAREEIAAFVEANSAVQAFLGKFADGKEQPYSTYNNYARSLCMFFKWLRVVKGLELSPSEFLVRVAMGKSSPRPEERLWGRNLLMQFSRDNPDFKGKSFVTKYHFFDAVKLFCDYHETPITSAMGVFGRRKGRKHEEPPFTRERAVQVLGVLSQRDRAICMTMLQSGQSIKQVLVDVNRQAEYILAEIDAGKRRIRFDFRERKGNNSPYYTYIGRDGIQEIQKWRPIRREYLDRAGVNRCKWLFITQDCKPVRVNCFEGQFRMNMKRHGLWTGPYSVRLHMFRQFFEQEASPPDRGVSKHYVSFMMGHTTEDGVNKNDVVGGVYDRRPRFDSRTVENEYAKLEPWLNVYSRRAETVFGEEQKQFLEAFTQILDKHPEKAAKFEKFLMEL